MVLIYLDSFIIIVMMILRVNLKTGLAMTKSIRDCNYLALVHLHF